MFVKAVRRTLMKLSPGVNFTNTFCKAFTQADPKSIKIKSRHHYVFALWGSAHVKVGPKMLVKLTSGVNFIKILLDPFG